MRAADYRKIHHSVKNEGASVGVNGNVACILNGQGESVPVSSFVRIVDTVGVEFVSQFNLLRSIALTVSPKSGISSSQAMTSIQSAAAACERIFDFLDEEETSNDEDEDDDDDDMMDDEE